MKRTALFASLAALILFSQQPRVLAAPNVQAAPRAAAAGSDNWYPANIAPPAGTQYPCQLTALPVGLPGIPEADRRYINHSYAMILRITQQKLIMVKALQENKDLQGAYARYYAVVADCLKRLKAEVPRKELKPFQDHVVSAVVLQAQFFNKAIALRAGGYSMEQVFALPEGHQASQLLVQAFQEMEYRFPSWSQATRDSIYHHLCALDLF
jgi:hypothetical protein